MSCLVYPSGVIFTLIRDEPLTLTTIEESLSHVKEKYEGKVGD